MAWFDLNPAESGKTWLVEQSMLVSIPPFPDVAIYQGLVHDGDSFVPNIPETAPTLPPLIVPIVHDHLWYHRIWADGTPVDRYSSDRLYRRMCLASTNRRRRMVARLWYWGVRRLGRRTWRNRKAGEPIPPEYQHLYGDTPEAWAARARLDRIMIGTQTGLLIRLPPKLP